jgi:hypothetical protein
MDCVVILFGLQRKWKWEIARIFQCEEESPETQISWLRAGAADLESNVTRWKGKEFASPTQIRRGRWKGVEKGILQESGNGLRHFRTLEGK